MFWGSKPLSLSGESAYGEYAWGRIRMWERTHVRERMGERLSGESRYVWGVRMGENTHVLAYACKGTHGGASVW